MTHFSYNQANLIFPMKSLAPIPLFIYNIIENSYKSLAAMPLFLYNIIDDSYDIIRKIICSSPKFIFYLTKKVSPDKFFNVCQNLYYM